MKRAIKWPVVAAVLVCLSLTTSEALSQDGVEDDPERVLSLSPDLLAAREMGLDYGPLPETEF